jgi:hypothetical protein
MKIEVGVRIGNWTIAELQDRRAVCRCRCGNHRALFIAALVDGTAHSSCGCMPRTTAEQISLEREATEHRQRHRQQKWKPGC